MKKPQTRVGRDEVEFEIKRDGEGVVELKETVRMRDPHTPRK